MRPIGSTAGHNPNTESILVRDFSYKFPGQKPVVLIEDDSGVFWQQGQPDFISEKLKPVPCVDDWSIRLKFNLVLNGITFKLEHIVYAQQVSEMYPLLFNALR